MTRVALLPVAAACCFAALASAQTPTYSVQIGGLTQPTAFAWDTTNMRVYAGNKAGQIFMATWNSTAFPSRFPSTPILDLSWKVASYGDLGLSALDVNSGYLYVAYNNQSQWGATGCTANGVIGNQNIGAMVGCPTGGVVSRFQLDAATGAIAAGAQENTIIALNLANFCTQFRKYSIGAVKVISATELVVSVGGGFNGASFGVAATQPDWGQYGGDPCTNGGAFRTQTNAMLNGKVLRVNINTGATTYTLAKGLKNPFRFALTSDLSSMYVAEPGFAVWEEINGPLSLTAASPVNYGFPCWDGPDQYAPMMASNASTCTALAPSTANPFYRYSKASTGAAAVSISAIAIREGQVWYGDCSQGIIAYLPLTNANAALTTVAGSSSGVMAVDMTYLPSLGVCFVNIAAGSVNCIAGTGAPNAASSTGIAFGAALIAMLFAAFSFSA